jgi:hypothetical protein
LSGKGKGAEESESGEWLEHALGFFHGPSIP